MGPRHTGGTQQEYLLQARAGILVAREPKAADTYSVPLRKKLALTNMQVWK